jgi:hypothetical protein
MDKLDCSVLLYIGKEFKNPPKLLFQAAISPNVHSAGHKISQEILKQK